MARGSSSEGNKAQGRLEVVANTGCHVSMAYSRLRTLLTRVSVLIRYAVNQIDRNNLGNA